MKIEYHPKTIWGKAFINPKQTNNYKNEAISFGTEFNPNVFLANYSMLFHSTNNLQNPYQQKTQEFYEINIDKRTWEKLKNVVQLGDKKSLEKAIETFQNFEKKAVKTVKNIKYKNFH